MAIDSGLIQSEILRRMIDARLPRVIRPANPAVGSEINVTMGTGFWWELLSVRFTFTTSATIATRGVSIAASDADGGTIWRLDSAVNQQQSIVGEYDFIVGLGNNSSGFVFNVGLPSTLAVIQSGMSLRTITGAIQGNDQYSGIVLYVREYSAAQVAAIAGSISEEFASEVIGGLEA